VNECRVNKQRNKAAFRVESCAGGADVRRRDECSYQLESKRNSWRQQQSGGTSESKELYLEEGQGTGDGGRLCVRQHIDRSLQRAERRASASEN